VTIVRLSKHWPTPIEPAPVVLEATVDNKQAKVSVKMPRVERFEGWETENAGALLEAEVLHKMTTLLAECLADEIRAHTALRAQK
jgi:hypothetical protein